MIIIVIVNKIVKKKIESIEMKREGRMENLYVLERARWGSIKMGPPLLLRVGANGKKSRLKLNSRIRLFSRKNISRPEGNIGWYPGRFHARWKAEGGTGHGNKSFAVRDRMIDVCSGKKNARFAAVTKWQIGVETSLVRVWDRLG